ncbi:MAG TPA: hypothetical protein VIM55_16815 [Mucilaginibacter sp.]
MIRKYFPLVISLISFSSFQTTPQGINTIILQDEHLTITPKVYYISKITDERTGKSPIASLVAAPATKGASPKTYTTDLQNGAISSVKHFIEHNLPRNTTLRPLVISLKQISIKENALTGNRVEGHVNIFFSFGIDRGEDLDVLPLASYNGSAVYNRDITQTQNIEPTLRRVLVNGLSYLDTWMNQQAGTNIKLAHAVMVSFSDYDDKAEGDSIYYSSKRPLTWADFQSKIPASRYEAEVFPTLGYDEHAEVIKGVVNLHIAVKACLPKSAAWAKPGAQTSYTLNHEQRHFDIVKIAAEHFKQKIRARKLPPENYDGPINEAYLNAYREMNDLQKQYDTETAHGTNTAEQQKWNEKIDRELKELGVK